MSATRPVAPRQPGLFMPKINYLAGDSLNRILKCLDVRMPFIIFIRPLAGTHNI